MKEKERPQEGASERERESGFIYDQESISTVVEVEKSLDVQPKPGKPRGVGWGMVSISSP